MSEFGYPVPDDLLDAVRRSKRVLLTTHENPDADGLGSLLGCGLALLDRGLEVRYAVSGAIADNLSILPGLERLELAASGDEFDLALLFDCHRLERIASAVAAVGRAKVSIAIDHHPLDPRGSDCTSHWVQESAPATTVMVQSLLRGLDHGRLGPDIASCLYAGLVTDTGGFRHPNTTHEALLAAAELVGEGANASKLAEALMHQRRPQALRLLGEALLATDYRLGGRVALMVIDRALLERSGAKPTESDGLVSHLTGVEGVRIAVMLRELEPASWRVSLRALEGQRVDAIARSFGGGGHRLAAAFASDLPREEIEALLLTAISEELESPKAA